MAKTKIMTEPTGDTSARALQIDEIIAFPISFPVKDGVTLGIGRAVKRDAVVVRVRTKGGLVGYGESHHGRCPGAIGHIVNSTLRQLAMGMNAADVTGIWARIYKFQLGSHGMGAACSMAMSGLDQALWDIRGKAVGWPLYRLLGGTSRAIPAYAGGISLGYQPPTSLVEEVAGFAASGFKAVKLRIGDTAERDIARIRAVRRAFPDLDILTDANTGYTVADARKVIPELDANAVGWLEEPFPAHDYKSYALAAGFGRVALAAGENHYTRFEFTRVIEDGIITILQPDLSKSGGITELLRIAAMASAWKLPIHPHTSTTCINMAANIHFLAAIENGGYFEADTAKLNAFRDHLGTCPYKIDSEGKVYPLEGPGIGVDIDEAFIKKHPLIEGPGFI
jgi:L-alanine-DL-glutamate epimerase-like enolase superfamily enzyme